MCSASLDVKTFFFVSDWMVSLNLRGWRKCSVRLGCLLICSLETRKHLLSAALSEQLLTPSPEKNTRKKWTFLLLFLLDAHFSVSVSTMFLYLQLCISFANVCTFILCGRASFLISVQVELKKKRLAVSLCVLCRCSNELRTQKTLSEDSLKKAPWLQVHARWNNCTV